MSGLTVEQIIKWIVGSLVIIVVIAGVYLFFKDYVIDFFKNLGGKEDIFLGLVK